MAARIGWLVCEGRVMLRSLMIYLLLNCFEAHHCSSHPPSGEPQQEKPTGVARERGMQCASRRGRLAGAGGAMAGRITPARGGGPV